jgi:CO/xanthine dehydrogenase Mo-binding subunit
VGEVSAIPTAPAVAAAYRTHTGRALTSLPLKLKG